MHREIFTSKRKSCICRLFVSYVNGVTHNIVNGKKLEDFFFDVPFYIIKIYNLLRIFDLEDSFKFVCNIKGSGKVAQADSVRYAIAKALRSYFAKIYDGDKDRFSDANYKLRKEGVITVNTKKVEPKHYGRLKSRCKRQRSKR